MPTPRTDDGSGSISSCSSESKGSVDYFAAQDRFDSEYDVDSRARRLRHRRLVARLDNRDGCSEFAAAGSKIVGLQVAYQSQTTAVSLTFDARTRQVSATPPFRSPKKHPTTFWEIGGTVYALDTSADDESNERCVFERLGPDPRRNRSHYGGGSWQWEALPRPPFSPDPHHPIFIVSHAVHPDGATVFVSVYDAGTFSFDAERLEWARHGDWVLPFDGEGYYVRDLDAWVGLCSEHRGHLAACRVVDGRSSSGGAAEAPACKCGRDLLFRR